VPKLQKPITLFSLLKKYYVLIVFTALFFLIIYEIGYRSFKNYFLKNKSIQSKAIIVDEKNYFGNSPVSHEFSYSYIFEINGTIYKRNSNDSSYELGDKILIEYVDFYPNFNKPKH
jgi:hypothetical protein